jgi:hypothetical protein
MEDMLDVYARPFNPKRPFVCFDESNKEQHIEQIELSVLARQCLNRRIADQQALAHETSAWEACRNAAEATVEWRFTTADARIKLKKLYPVFNPS